MSMEPLNSSNFENFVVYTTISNVLFLSNKVEQCNQMKDLVKDLAAQDDFRKCKYFSVDIENSPELAKRFSVSSVPTLIFFYNGNEVDRVVGADANQVLQKVQKVLDMNASIEQRLLTLINQERVMVFIKGTPQQPRCGFTRSMIGLLNDLNVEYGYFDILTNDDVRENLKSYSNWPTYPQLYVNGELVGGLDIIQDLHNNGQLVEMLKTIIHDAFE